MRHYRVKGKILTRLQKGPEQTRLGSDPPLEAKEPEQHLNQIAKILDFQSGQICLGERLKFRLFF